MKRTKKVLALLLAAVLLVTTSVAVTVAYLTSSTEVVNNTFTVGQVKITLDETDVDLYGEKDSDNRVIKNDYKLIPGHNYTKDPTVHVGDNSENCWLFVKVVNEITAIEADKTIAAQMTELGWTPVAGKEHVFAYNAIVSKGTDVKVFNEFTIKTDADVTGYEGKTITINAYAVQADGFTTAAAAWAAAPKADW